MRGAHFDFTKLLQDKVADYFATSGITGEEDGFSASSRHFSSLSEEKKNEVYSLLYMLDKFYTSDG